MPEPATDYEAAVQRVLHGFYEELSDANLKHFAKWLADKIAWPIFVEFIEHCKRETAEGTLGNPDIKELPAFLMAQGAWFVLEELKSMPNDAAAVVKERISQAESKPESQTGPE